eukprot:1194125-Prorocentrum_minimum.AAC.1
MERFDFFDFKNILRVSIDQNGAVRTNRHRQSGRLDDGLDGVSHIHDLDGPIRHRKCRYILTMDQSYTGSA